MLGRHYKKPGVEASLPAPVRLPEKHLRDSRRHTLATKTACSYTCRRTALGLTPIRSSRLANRPSRRTTKTTAATTRATMLLKATQSTRLITLLPRRPPSHPRFSVVPSASAYRRPAAARACRGLVCGRLRTCATTGPPPRTQEAPSQRLGNRPVGDPTEPSHATKRNRRQPRNAAGPVDPRPYVRRNPVVVPLAELVRRERVDWRSGQMPELGARCTRQAHDWRPFPAPGRAGGRGLDGDR